MVSEGQRALALGHPCQLLLRAAKRSSNPVSDAKLIKNLGRISKSILIKSR